MEYTLICNEASVRAITGVSENLATEYLLPCMGEAQRMYLQRTIGSALLRKLQDIVNGDAESDEYYAEALSLSQYVIAYKAAADVCTRVSFKIVNAGVVRTTDDNVQSVTLGEVNALRSELTNKADWHTMNLQKWLLNNRTHIPELTEAVCADIRANLRSAASCGLFLGGARGKVIR